MYVFFVNYTFEYSLEIYIIILQVSKPKALKCGTFGHAQLQKRSIATGDFDGQMQIWYSK